LKLLATSSRLAQHQSLDFKPLLQMFARHVLLRADVMNLTSFDKVMIPVTF